MQIGGPPLADGLLVPSHEIDSYLALGWRLGDEPGCETARLYPVGLNLVPKNHKKLASRVVRGLAKLEICNARYILRAYLAQ